MPPSSSCTRVAQIVDAVQTFGFPRWTVRRARRWLDTGAVSSVDLCVYCHSLALAGEQEWRLNAFERLLSIDDICDQAREADKRRQHTNNKITNPSITNKRSDLDGIPVSIKANLAVASQPLTAGSRILGGIGNSAASESAAASAQKVGYDAQVTTSLLHEGGAVLIGITAMDEFGMGSLGTNILRRGEMTRNPLPYLCKLEASSSEMKNSIDYQHRHRYWNDDERALEFLRLPPDIILEIHAHISTATATRSQEPIRSESDDSLAVVGGDGDNYGGSLLPSHDHHTRRLRRSSWDYSAGGSSCGSAVSVAHGSSLISLGSDTGGSVRLPAAWCGIVGFKPSYGLLSRHGLVSYASSLDTIGILAPTVDCASTALNTLVHHSEEQIVRDSTQTLPSYGFRSSVQSVVKDFSVLHTSTGIYECDVLNGVKVGLPAAFSVVECPPSVVDAWSRGAECLANHGAVVETVTDDRLSPQILQLALSAYYILVSAEASSNLSRYDGFRYGMSAADLTDTFEQTAWEGSGVGTTMDPEVDSSNRTVQSNTTHHSLSVLEKQYARTRQLGLGQEVIRRILCGNAVLSSNRFLSHYQSAAKLRALLSDQFSEILRSDNYHINNKTDKDGFDILLVPTAVFPPFQKGSILHKTDIFANDIMTVPMSLVGLPSISVPFGMWKHDDRFSVGLQLAAPRHDEGLLLRTASILQKSGDNFAASLL